MILRGWVTIIAIKQTPNKAFFVEPLLGNTVFSRDRQCINNVRMHLRCIAHKFI